jgi:hypothetical protein
MRNQTPIFKCLYPESSGLLVREPDVWWGEEGIDALIWADTRSYAEPLPDAPVEVSALSLAGDSR